MSRAIRRRGAPWAIAAGLLLALAGCTSPNKPKPALLEEYTAKLGARQVWSASIGKVQFPLIVAARGGRFVVADDDGTVTALDADTGREAWRADAGGKLSAGVGSDGRVAAVVTREGDLVAIDAGKVLWRKPLGTRVTTPPLVAGERVFVLGVDRSLQAFDALDGRTLWSTPRSGDPLTLSQAGVLMAVGNTLVAGQAARLVGFDPLQGTSRWDVALASPRGTNEVERLADLVAPVARFGDTVCARAFQAAVGCVDASRGALAWARNVGGSRGIGGDAETIVAADGSDRLTAWRSRNGEPLWNHERLLNRQLSTPLLDGASIVVGDLEGQVHWLARDSGDTLLRLSTDGSPVIAQPVLSGGTLLVATRNGGLFAFRKE